MSGMSGVMRGVPQQTRFMYFLVNWNFPSYTYDMNEVMVVPMEGV